MVLHKKKSNILNSLENENWLTAIVVLTSILQFVLLPIYGSTDFFENFMRISWILILMAGILTMTRYKKSAFIIAIVPILFSIFAVISIFNPSPFILLMEFILTVCSLALLITLVLIKILANGPVTGNRIVGSIVVYMLLAQLWAMAYIFIYKHIDHAFQLTFNLHEKNLHATFLYFSYTTITTSGFGDIIPVNPIVRSVVQVESIVGILYPVILIGRLVSGATSRKKGAAPKEDE